MILTPRITIEQAVVATGLAVFFATMGLILIKNRFQNRYPVAFASGMLFSASAWVLNNIYVDRTSFDWVRLWFGRISFVTAYAVIVFFVLFCLQFPPSTQKKTRLAILIATCIAVVVGSIFSLHPNGIFSGIDSSTDTYVSAPPLWADILLHLSYILLALLGYVLLVLKVRDGSPSDRIGLWEFFRVSISSVKVRKYDFTIP
ncbi:MAG: hypothetical protein V1895_02520 [Parcubacteria group bacterium]